MTYREKVEGRLQAAQINGGAAAAIPRGRGLYTVAGRAGARYSVRIFDRETIMCDCPAGRHSAPCWHAAAAFLRAVADAAAEEAVA